MTTTTSTSPDTIELAPSYTIPIVLVVLAVPLLLVQVWFGLAIALFGTFLMIQAATLRLRFTAADLDIYRGETLIRRFPYADWLNWEIFWSPVANLVLFQGSQEHSLSPNLVRSQRSARGAGKQNFPHPSVIFPGCWRKIPASIAQS